MFNNENREGTEFNIFESKKIIIKVDVEKLEVVLVLTDNKGVVKNIFYRPYTLAELPLFKNVTEIMKG